MNAVAVSELKVLCWMLSTFVTAADKKTIPEPYLSHLETVVEEILNTPYRPKPPSAIPRPRPQDMPIEPIEELADLVTAAIVAGITQDTDREVSDDATALIGLTVMRTLTLITASATQAGARSELVEVVQAGAQVLLCREEQW